MDIARYFLGELQCNEHVELFLCCVTSVCVCTTRGCKNYALVSFVSLVADTIIFNSYYNMDAFLNSIQSFLSVIPDYRPKELSERIAPKCTVLYFPVEEHRVMGTQPGTNKEGEELGESKFVDSVDETVSCVLPVPHSEALHILWPHRW